MTYEHEFDKTVDDAGLTILERRDLGTRGNRTFKMIVIGK